MIDFDGASPAAAIAVALVARFGNNAHAEYDRLLESMPVVDGAGLAFDWSFWARPKQRAPESSRWRRWGFLTGRGFGKTLAISKYINEEIERSPTPLLILLIAQDEQSSVDIQVNGPSGLIATAPPWNRPVWEPSILQLAWPNGSRAYVRTPEVPGKIRGLEYHLGWASELQSWPTATRDEAWSNVLLSVRLGAARVVWDSTPKRRHPILLALLDENARDPETYPVVRGATDENPFLPAGYKEDLHRKYGNTSKGREELFGEMLEDAEGALFRAAWIERLPAPAKYLRRVVAVDPAVTNKKGSDTTGIVSVGLGPDGRAYVIKDSSGKMDVGKWADVVLDHYAEGCDLVLAETNKGGQLVVQNIRAAAKDRNLSVVVIGKDERPPPPMRGVVFVRELHAQGSKGDRAEPVATAYEKGRVAHVLGADLASLEDTLTTWVPSPNADSPGDLDALVHGVTEVLGLRDNKRDNRGGMQGIGAAQAALTRPAGQAVSLGTLFQGVPGRGGRI